MSHYLLPENDPAVLAMNKGKEAKAAKATKASRKSKVQNDTQDPEPEKWQIDHMQAYSQATLSWPPELSPQFCSKGQALSRRSLEVLWLWQCTGTELTSMDDLEACDLNMSMYFGRGS